MSQLIIQPQAGFQLNFLASQSDITIGGGAAGAGKSFALLLEAARHHHNKDYHAIIFRRTAAQVRNAGGLWDTAGNIYPLLGAVPNVSRLTWLFPSGSTVRFGHLQHERNIYDHQGTQYPFIGFDELTHFTERQFFYVLTRNRSLCGVRPYIRATCNPDPDSWLARLVDWWIDKTTGYPIPEYAGQQRLFVREGEALIWGNNVAELQSIIHNEQLTENAKSISFIPGNIQDNPLLMHNDPAYLANLLSQDAATRSALLDGNWLTNVDELSLFSSRDIDAMLMKCTLSHPRPQYYISCDVARYGRDLAVICCWRDWTLLQGHVFTSCDLELLYNQIERSRKELNIAAQNVVVDEDGIGGGLVDRGRYQGFRAALAPINKENYLNLKTQCYFTLSQLIQQGAISLGSVTWYVNQVQTENLNIGKLQTTLSLKLKQELRAIHRIPLNHTNEGKFRINSKDAQKHLLAGRSPDLADALMIRCYIHLKLLHKPSGSISW